MSSTIEVLYYCNIPLSERDFKQNSEYAHILQLAGRNGIADCSTMPIFK